MTEWPAMEVLTVERLAKSAAVKVRVRVSPVLAHLGLVPEALFETSETEERATVTLSTVTLLAAARGLAVESAEAVILELVVVETLYAGVPLVPLKSEETSW